MRAHLSLLATYAAGAAASFVVVRWDNGTSATWQDGQATITHEDAITHGIDPEALTLELVDQRIAELREYLTDRYGR